MTVYFQHYYEGAVRESILSFKEQGDIKLGSLLFLNIWEFIFKRYVIIPIPSTDRANKKRGFKHSSVLSEPFRSNIAEDVIIHTGEVEQALKENRASISNELRLENIEKIKNKRVLIVDDILTSGSTVQTAYSLLDPHTKKTRILILAIHPRFKTQRKRFHLPF